jgi:hypothetical protein
VIENLLLQALFLLFAINTGNGNFCISKLKMAVQVADKIVIPVFHDDWGWEPLNTLQTVFWNLPADRLLADRTLHPFQPFSH